jgi:ferredoxin
MFADKAIELLVPANDLRVNPVLCTHRRFGRSRCRRCADACMSGAMEVAADGPRRDPARCTGCRRCEAVCPTGAVQGEERELATLVAALAEHTNPVLGCRREGVAAHVHTGCLGFLEWEALLALALFFPQGLALNLSRCRECPNGAATALVEEALAAVRRLPGNPAGERLRLALAPHALGYREASLSRREFFGFLRRRSADAATAAAVRLQERPLLPDGRRKGLPPRRRLLLQGLNLLPPEVRMPVAARLFPARAFTATCSACTGCAGICPTGALATDAGDPPTPVFRPQLCCSCGLCTEFCRKQGVARVNAGAEDSREGVEA